MNRPSYSYLRIRKPLAVVGILLFLIPWAISPYVLRANADSSVARAETLSASQSQEKRLTTSGYAPAMQAEATNTPTSTDTPTETPTIPSAPGTSPTATPVRQSCQLNLFLGRSSYISDSRCADPSYVNDGSWATGWSCRGTSCDPRIWDVDMGQQVSLSRFLIDHGNLYSAGCLTRVDLYVSNNRINWTFASTLYPSGCGQTEWVTSPGSWQWYQFRMSGNPNCDGYVYVREIEACGAPSPTYTPTATPTPILCPDNPFRLGTATAGCNPNNAHYVNDGFLNTGWTCGDTSCNYRQWTINMGRPYQLDRFTIHHGDQTVQPDAGCLTDVLLQVSNDGVNYFDVSRVFPTNCAPFDVTVSPGNWQYYRFLVYGNPNCDGYVYVREIEACGVIGPTFTPSRTPTPTFTRTPTQTNTPTRTNTRTNTATFTSTFTATPLPTPPLYTISYYIQQDSAQAAQELGCQARRRGEEGIIVLDFGAPVTLPNQAFGTQLFEVGSRISLAEIKEIMLNFAYGFAFPYWCGANEFDALPKLVIAAGVSNGAFQDPNTGYWHDNLDLTFEHGQAWASMVNEIDAELEQQGLLPNISVAGAYDSEYYGHPNADCRDSKGHRGCDYPMSPGADLWTRYTLGSGIGTNEWAEGYDSTQATTNKLLLYNFGDCSDCPREGSPSSWPTPIATVLSRVFHLTWELPLAVPLPQIYRESLPFEWYNLRWYAHEPPRNRYMVIHGAMTGCQDAPASEPCTPIPSPVRLTPRYNEACRSNRSPHCEQQYQQWYVYNCVTANNCPYLPPSVGWQALGDMVNSSNTPDGTPNPFLPVNFNLIKGVTDIARQGSP
jgi:hypothetical protein